MSKHSALVTRLLDHSTLRVPALPKWLRADLIEAADVIAELSKPITQPADQIPWSEYPFAMWAAKDENGDIFVFDVEPAIPAGDASWVCPSFEEWYCTEVHLPVTIHGDWRSSLRKRPEGV